MANNYSKLTNYIIAKRHIDGMTFEKTWYCSDSRLDEVIRMFNRKGYSDIEICKWNEETQRFEA